MGLQGNQGASRKKLNWKEEYIMEILFLLSLLIVAYLYSSIGHGGASGYLSVMALFSLAPETMKSSALAMNLFVSGIAFVNYYRAGYFKWGLIWPFLITSIPFAYLGARINVSELAFNTVLVFFLVLAIIRLLFIKTVDPDALRKWNIPLFILIGALLGFFSGIIGIGGGIILTPVLIMFRWSTLKQAAAVSALFIFLNSVSGLFSIYSKGLELPEHFVFWVISVVAGALIGGWVGSRKIKPEILRYVLAVVLLLACIKVFI